MRFGTTRVPTHITIDIAKFFGGPFGVVTHARGFGTGLDIAIGSDGNPALAGLATGDGFFLEEDRNVIEKIFARHDVFVFGAQRFELGYDLFLFRLILGVIDHFTIVVGFKR